MLFYIYGTIETSDFTNTPLRWSSRVLPPVFVLLFVFILINILEPRNIPFGNSFWGGFASFQTYLYISSSLGRICFTQKISFSCWINPIEPVHSGSPVDYSQTWWVSTFDDNKCIKGICKPTFLRHLEPSQFGFLNDCNKHT